MDKYSDDVQRGREEVMANIRARTQPHHRPYANKDLHDQVRLLLSKRANKKVSAAPHSIVLTGLMDIAPHINQIKDLGQSPFFYHKS